MLHLATADYITGVSTGCS